jgi:CheY-like chemotaxis protein
MSEPGRGTRFCVYLPVAAAPIAELKPPAEEAASCGTETVLIAEDDAAVRAVAAEILVRHGYTVILARNGAEALMRADAHHDHISLVITDVVMPAMDGAALVRQLAAKHPRIRALFMSGYTGDDITRRGVIESGVPLLEKPFTVSELTRRVREVLDAV